MLISLHVARCSDMLGCAKATAPKTHIRPRMEVPLVQEPSGGESGTRFPWSEKRQLRHRREESRKDKGGRRH